MIGAARGYRVRLCVPRERDARTQRTLQAFGAEVAFTDPMEGSDGAIVEPKAMCTPRIRSESSIRTSTTTPATGESHYETRGRRFWSRRGPASAHFVAGLGTSGTFMGAVGGCATSTPAIA